MEGDNQYNAEGFGKVDADRFVRFATLPPVLHLQLKRFEFNMQTYSFDKVREAKVHCRPVASPLIPSYSASYSCGTGGVLRPPPPHLTTRNVFCHQINTEFNFPLEFDMAPYMCEASAGAGMGGAEASAASAVSAGGGAGAGAGTGVGAGAGNDASGTGAEALSDEPVSLTNASAETTAKACLLAAQCADTTCVELFSQLR